MEFSLILIIVDEEHTDKITGFLRENTTRIQLVSQGFGTANSELLDLLGLGESDKSVIISLLSKQNADALLHNMPKQVKLGKRTKGIVMSAPLAGITSTLSTKLSSEGMSNMDIVPEKLVPDDAEKHELIIAIVNEDSSEEVMEAAKAAGANGGTVINARRVGLDEGNTFMGIPIQVKKEMILILTDRKKKLPIMKAINVGFGLNTPAHGLIFSIPVDGVAWLE